MPESERAYFEPRFGADFGRVRVHSDAQAAESAKVVNVRAYTVGRDVVFGEGQYAPETSEGRRLLAHELSHVVQQSIGLIGTSNNGIIQRDLALEPPAEVPEQPELTDVRVQAAIRYNSASYSTESTRLIQDLVGVNVTGTFDETTVRAIAHIQRTFGLGSDGKVGPNTYDLLIRELQAEHTAPGTCLTLFQIVGPEPLRFFRSATNLNQGTIGSRFSVRARFDPRCRCGDFEYRQYIAGSVVLHDINAPTTAAPVILNNRFNVPGGLAGALREDGDTN